MGRQQRKVSSKIFDAASSPVRIQIVRLIHTKGPLSYSEIMEALQLDPSRDAGKFAYHLRSILQAGLIDVDRETRKYILTDLGRMVVSFSHDIEDYAMKKNRKLMVRSSRLAMEEFDRNKIAKALAREAGVPTDLAERIAEEAEERLLALQTKYLTAPLIREFVNAILVEKGLEEYRHKLTRLGLPVYDVSQKIKEAGEASQKAETVHRVAGDAVLEEYTLLNILPRDVADAHLSGSINICNTGYWILKPSEFQHDLRIFLREGLRSERLDFLSSSLPPPKTLEAALLLTSNILKTTSIEASNGQAIDYFNIFLAPFTRRISSEQLKDALALFVQNLGQSLYGIISDATIGLELTIPEYLRDIPAVGPSGQNTEKYGDYEDEVHRIFDLIIDAMFEDAINKPILNPYIVIKIRPETLNEKFKQSLLNAHLLAAKCGTPYFANLTKEWQTGVSYFASGTRLANDWTRDWEIDSLRTGNLDNVIINLPRIAYEAGGNDGKFFGAIDFQMDLAVKALEIKYKIMEERIHKGTLPILSQLTTGEAYFRLENSLRTISIVGLDEAINAHIGNHIGESKNSLEFAMKTISHMNAYTHKYSRKPFTRIVLSQTTDDKAAQRLAELDVEKYGWARVRVQGTKEGPYYTTMPIAPLELNTPVNDRLQMESNFHPMLTGGHLLPIQLDEPEQNSEKLLTTTERICNNYDIGLFTFTRNLTYCSNCRKIFGGLKVKCPDCNSSNTLNAYSRSSAKYLPLQWWSSAKISNLPQRFAYLL
ncbi:MAG TPA: anaerobic ribonucleoside-triphosphate reductase [archaeon]|nr:anaerobic ribonucleoside-triphosphate reductase [archaeon]